MRFDVYPPCERLAPYVKSFAVQETAAESVYKVLPDTGMVIGFQYKGRLARMEGEVENPLSISGVSGLADRSRTFKNSPDIGTVLVFFHPAGAVPFFRAPLHELFRESVSLDNFMLRSELLCLEEELGAASTDRTRIGCVERFLIRRMNGEVPDKLVLMAISLIHQHQGNIRIKELAQQLNISQSPLEKRFRQAVGATPKKFASIVRLRHVLAQYRPSTSLTELGYVAGYYDQAHFIKEFRAFTGESPERYFSGGE